MKTLKTTLIKKLLELRPGVTLAHSATDELKEPAEVRQFLKEYVDYIAWYSKEPLIKGRQGTSANIVRRNIELALPNHDEDIKTMWIQALQEIEIPRDRRTKKGKKRKA